jgi:hypothetical protein
MTYIYPADGSSNGRFLRPRPAAAFTTPTPMAATANITAMAAMRRPQGYYYQPRQYYQPRGLYSYQN